MRKSSVQVGLIILLLAGFSLVGVTAFANGNESEAEDSVDTAGGDVIDHGSFETLLEIYVDGRGMVDYGRWHGNEEARGELNRYVEAVGAASVTGKSEASRLAFYLNAYNALVLHDILERWPVETVMEEEGFFDAKKHRVAGQEMTLNELEHDRVIRRRFDEPRIHFVLVCAALDCPRLRTTALTEANLERELAAATGEFVPRATRLVGENKVETSQLFNWFSEDFERGGSVANYLREHISDSRIREALNQEDVEISFAEYDWAINKQ